MRALRTGIVLAALFLAPLAVAQEASEAEAQGVPAQGAPGPEATSAPAAEPMPAPSTAPPPLLPVAKSIEELLDFVKRGYSEEREENRAREARFQQAKADQVRLLAQAEATLAREEARSERREELFAASEVELTTLTERLDERLGNLGELFGVVRQVAGDMQGHAWESVTSSQFGNRRALLEKMGRSKALPTTDDLEGLWFELLREMAEQGKVVRYPTTVLTAKGGAERREVTRAGVFSVISDGRYLHWDAAIQKVRELNRQPPSRYLATVESFEESSNGGFVRLAIDPSRGSLLAALIDTPSARERIGQGGPVGYTIIVLGLFAGVIGVFRLVAVSIASRKVAAQVDREQPDKGNALGRDVGVVRRGGLSLQVTPQREPDGPEATLRLRRGNPTLVCLQGVSACGQDLDATIAEFVVSVAQRREFGGTDQ